MSKTIAIAHEKGGTGKTTTTINLGIGLANKGKKVLLVDADASGNLTVGLGIKNRHQLPITIATLMNEVIANSEERTPIENAIIEHAEGVHLLPANRELTATENNLVNAFARDSILSEILKPVKDKYDYILIDCRPSISMTVINALAAADSVIVPVEAAYFASENLQPLFSYIGMVRSRVNPSLKIDGILITKVDMRKKLTRKTIEQVKDTYGRLLHVFDVQIPEAVKVAEAPSEGKSIFAHEPNSPATTAYRKLAKEVIDIDRDRTQEVRDAR